MRFPVFSWPNLVRKLGSSCRLLLQRVCSWHCRPLTTAEIKRRAYLRPGFDQLEDRQMLSATMFINDAGGGENGSYSFTVGLSGSHGDVSVDYATASGTATSGSDFTAANGTLNFTASESTKFISVPITGDSIDENNETFTVSLSNLQGATFSDSQATGTISDDDSAPSVGFDPASVTVNEANGTATFTVKLTGNLTEKTVTVQHATGTSGTATSGSDFTATSGTLTFASGDREETFQVPILNDLTFEGFTAENFPVTLSNPTNANVGTSSATGYITDNDSQPTLSISDAQVNESAGTVTISVALSNPSYQTITVNYATANGTATTAGNDYTQASGTLTFNPGDSEKTFTVSINNDSLKEADEVFHANLSSPSNATIADGQNDVRIVDNDATGRTNLDDVPLDGGADYHQGNVIETYTLPSGLEVHYNSLTRPRPIIAVETVQPHNGAIPDKIKAELYYNGSLASTVYYSTTGLAGGDPQRFVLQADATALATGTYDWEVRLTEYHGSEVAYRTFTGKSTIVNRNSSEFGANWWADGLDQLSIEGSGAVVLVYSAGTTARYTPNGSGGYVTPDGFTATLVKNGDNTYRLTETNGTKLDFDTAGKLTARTDRNGNATTYTYSSGRLTTITDPNSRQTTLAYTSGLLTSITDPAGRLTTFTQTSGKLTAVTAPDPDGAGSLSSPVWTYTYDATIGFMTEAKDPRLNAVTYDYDFAGRLEARIYPGNITYSVDPVVVQGLINVSTGTGTFSNPAPLPEPADAVATLIDPLGNDVRITTDRFGGFLTYEDALGKTTVWVRNTDGLATQMTLPDPDGAGSQQAPVYAYAYDAKDNLTQLTLPDSSTRQWTYETSFSQVTAYTDELGRQTTYVVSATNGNTTSMTQPDPDGAGPLTAPVTSYTYDTSGNLLTETDPLGNVTTYAYDSLDRVTSETGADPDGAGPLTAAQTTYTYNTADQLLTVTDPLSRVTTYEYDTLGRRTKVIQPDPDGVGSLTAPQTSYTYDAAGNLLTETDPLGNVTSYVYDALNRNTRVTQPDPDGAGSLTAPQTNYTYDANGNLLTVSDPLSRVTTYEYDELGRTKKITEADPDGAGSLTSPVTNLAYDALSRLTSETDPLGNLTSYLYDSLGRTTRVTQPDPDGAGSLTAPQTNYTYDAAGQLLTVTDPLSRITTYEYDNLGRQKKVIQPDPDGAGSLTAPQWQYTYDAAGNLLTVTDPLGNVTSYLYDNLGRTTRVTEADPDGAGSLTAPQTNYAYDAASQLTSVTDPLSRVTSYEYDNLGRQKKVIEPDPDGAGSLTAPQWQYTYDAAGNLLTVTDPLGNVTSYLYDNLGRTSASLRPIPMVQAR